MNIINVMRSEVMDTALLESMKARGRDIPDFVRAVFKVFLTENRIDVVHADNLHMDYFQISKTLVDVCHENGTPYNYRLKRIGIKHQG